MVKFRVLRLVLNSLVEIIMSFFKSFLDEENIGFVEVEHSLILIKLDSLVVHVDGLH